MTPIYSIQHNVLSGPSYYCGPQLGWVADITQAVQYASLALANAAITAGGMNATAILNTVATGVILNFNTYSLLGIAGNPATITSTLTGPAVDLQTSGGTGLCLGIQCVGTATGTGETLAGKMQQSADGSTNWSDISGGAFATVNNTFSNPLQMKTFTRTQQFVRYIGTVGGSSPSFTVGVIAAQATA